jgi:YfiH family protein
MNNHATTTNADINVEAFELAYHDTYADFDWRFKGRTIVGPRAVISTRKAGSMALNLPAEDPNTTTDIKTFEGFMIPGEIVFTENRLAFLRSLGVNPARVYSCRQTHSLSVCLADSNAMLLEYVDGLVGNSDAVLSITVGDCLPVFLYDTANGAYALCHSGWKGTGIVNNALALMVKQFGADLCDIVAVLGPCIRGEDYAVDTPRAVVFERNFGGAGKFPLGPVVTHDETGCFIDLQAANAHLLADAGVQNICYCTNSTFTDERLGSYRREGAKHYTKMMALCGRW